MATSSLSTVKGKMMQTTILQVLPSLVSGGVETGTLDLASKLVKQGYRSLVVSSGGPLVDVLKQQGSTHITLPVHTKNPVLMWLNSRKLAKVIEEEGVNLIHARSRAPAWSCLWASKKVGIPFITTFHGVYGHQNKLKRWYNSAMLRSQRTIAVSHFVKEHIETVYPGYKDKVALILRGINLEVFKAESGNLKTNALRKNWQIPLNTQVIILPGRLTRIKGHKVLIEALSRLTQENFFCLLVGDEPNKEGYKLELQNLIQEKGLQKRIRFTGDCRDMASVYSLADVVVSASIKPESFGRVACEAQLMKRIVIATNHGGSQETISPALREYMCKPNDAESMTNALKKALKLNKQTKEELGMSAASFIQDNFSLDKMCQDTIHLYELELSKQPNHDDAV